MSDSSGLLLVVLAFVGFCVVFLGVLGVIVYVIVLAFIALRARMAREYEEFSVAKRMLPLSTFPRIKSAPSNRYVCTSPSSLMN